MDNKYLFIFAISVFLILSISGAGIYLNDEWMVGQQLNQLSQGHQVLTNEGKYGYNANGTAGNYMIQRSNILAYSMALPIISLPAFLLFSILSTEFTRIFIIMFWGLLGTFILYHLKKTNIISKKVISTLGLGFGSLVCINLAISTDFIMTGKFIPYEMIPIVFTNILLYGVFSVVCFKITEILFTEKFKQLVGWILCISMSSLIFWSTTLKDHMLVATLVILICYFTILQTDKYSKCLSYLITGILIWSRPEIGLFVLAGIVIYDIYYHFKYSLSKFITSTIWVLPGMVCLLLNNYFVTSNPLLFPFLIANSNQVSIGMTATSNISQLSQSEAISGYVFSVPFKIIYTQLHMPERWINLIFAPTSGALGVVTPLCLFLFAILVYIKYRPVLSPISKSLFIIGISTIIYYISMAGSYLGADSGITPDIRYLSAAYAPLTLFALTLLPYNLNYRKIFKNIFIYVPIIIIISIFIISTVPQIGGTYKLFRMLPHIISTLSLAIMTILLVNDRNDDPSKWLEKIIPVIIASAFTWQIVITFVYHISKAHHYPMFLPITELLYKLLFGV